MAATHRGAKTLLQMYPQLKKGIEMARRDILGHLPQHGNTTRSGYKTSVKQLQGVYLNQYYHDPIDKAARKVSEKEQRRGNSWSSIACQVFLRIPAAVLSHKKIIPCLLHFHLIGGTRILV